MRKIGASENVTNCMKVMYQDIKVCVKCGQNQTSSCQLQTKGAHQGCGLSPYLFNIFLNDIIEYIHMQGIHPGKKNGLRIPGPLFSDDLAIESCTSYRLQKKIE
jgi:hypothetical protein